MAAAAGAVDEIIREYLLFRGFVQTLRILDQEKRDDKEKGLRVNRIVEYILLCINKSDFAGLQSFWNFLSRKFFSRLNHDLMSNAHKLESSMLRLFLINAHRSGRHDEVKQFFEHMSSSLKDRSWKEWFALPYLKNPDQHPAFKMYYTKEWYDVFVVSLYNFFSVMLAGLPLPTLLQFDSEHQKIQALELEKNLLHKQLAHTKQTLLEAESSIEKLEARLAQSVAAMSAEKVTNKTSRQQLFKSGQRQQTKSVEQIKAKSPPYSPPEELRIDVTPEQRRDSIESKVSPTRESTDTLDRKVSKGSIQQLIVVDQYVYKDHTAPISHCRFSPNGTLVASVDVENVLRVWEPTTSLSTKCHLKYTKIDLLSLDWVHHGGSDNLLMLGFGRGQVKLLDVPSSQTLWEFATDRNYPRILSVACSSSSPSFAVSAAGWHTQPLLPVAAGNRSTAGLTSPSLPSQLTKSSELMLVSKKSNTGNELFDPTPGELSIWDINQQKIQTVLPLTPAIAVNCMAFNHNSNLLVTGGVDGMIRLFDVVQGECLCGWTAHHGEILNVQFSSDETSVYSLGQDNQFCQWSTLRSTERLAQYNIHKYASSPTNSWDKGYFPTTPPGNLFAFESEDKYVLTCSPSESIVYQITEGSLNRVLTLSDHCGPVTCVDWVPGRRSYSTCITGSVDSTVRVVNLLS